MAERPEDLNLPNAVIARIIKEALPDGVNVSKDARQAISKAASVFVLYATSCANNIAMEKKRKTLAAQDVLDAMKEMEFDKFIEPLKSSLESYKREQQGRKEAAAENRKKSKEASAVTEEAEPEEEEAEDVQEVNDATDDGDESQTDDVIMQD